MKILLPLVFLTMSLSAIAQEHSGPKTIYDVNATDSTQFTYFDLNTGQTVPTADSAGTVWDVAFCRSKIIFNAKSGLQVRVADTAWAGLLDAPADGFVTDQPENRVLKSGSGRGWYWFNSTTGIVKPVKNRTIILKWPDGTLGKMQIVSYYRFGSTEPNDEAGYYSFRYLISSTPDLSQHLDSVYNFNANSRAFFNLASNSKVDTSLESTPAWDMYFERTDIVVNSGKTYPGSTDGQVVRIPFSQIVKAPDTGYLNNVEAVPGGSDNGWYHYDFLLTHTVQPIDTHSIVMVDSYNRYVKMEIRSYYQDAPESPTLLNTSGWYSFQYFYQPDGSRNMDPYYYEVVTPEPGDTLSNEDPDDPTTHGSGSTGGGGGGNSISENVKPFYGLFPNPSTDGNFNVFFELAEEILSVNIYNLAGKNVFSVKAEAIKSGKLNTTLESGVYVVAINTNSTTYVQRVVIK